MDSTRSIFSRKRKLSISLPPQSTTAMYAVLNDDPRGTPSIRSEPLRSMRRPLTLSAYRRPEATVRVADLDTSRSLTDEYELNTPECGVLGHGAMSTVRLAVRKSDRKLVAIKFIEKHHALRSRRLKKRRRHLDEWEVLRRMKDHPNVVSLLDVFETDDDLQLVMEFCEGGELYNAIQRKREGTCLSRQSSFGEDQAAIIARQMLSVLHALHSQSIVHRDIKPENILLTSGDRSSLNTKLCDFGVARVVIDDYQSDYSSSDGEVSPFGGQRTGRTRSYSTVSSDFYTAPEVCYSGSYGTAVDVYALGVTLYVVLCGCPPSYNAMEEDYEGLFSEPHWEGISQECKNLIRRMLDPEPSSRITAEQALGSKWIADYKAEAQYQKTNVTKHAPPATIFSPSKPRPVVDLELVRTRLYSQLERIANHGSDCSDGESSPKRARSDEARTPPSAKAVAAALSDIYGGLASAADSATAAAAGIVCDADDGTARILAEECDESSFSEEVMGTLKV